MKTATKAEPAFNMFDSEPLEAEIERNICKDEVEIDAPVVIYFCSEECKAEYLTQSQSLKK